MQAPYDVRPKKFQLSATMVYTIEHISERRIPKFQILGHDYKVKMDLSGTYAELHQALHHEFQGRYFEIVSLLNDLTGVLLCMI